MTTRGGRCRRGRHLNGALLLHGFTATPDSVMALAGPIGSLGLTVSAPLLRGHGKSSPDHLRGVSWQDWVEDAETALKELVRDGGCAVVIGHSMGSLVALHLAARHPELVDALVLATPPLRISSILAPDRPLHFLAPLVARMVDRWAFRTSLAEPACAIVPDNYPWAPTSAITSFFDMVSATMPVIPQVSAPTLIIQGRRERVVLPESAAILMASLSTPPGEKRVCWLDRSDHQVFCDCERHLAVDAVSAFVAERIAVSGGLARSA